MLSQSCDYSISIFTNILSPMHCWGRVASSKVSIVITSIFSILFAIYSLKGVIYAVLITVACFSLQQGLNSTWTGRLGTKKTFFPNLSVISGGHKRSDSTEACLTPHLLQPFATEPYSQLCLSSFSLSAFALIKVMSLEGKVTSNYLNFWRS